MNDAIDMLFKACVRGQCFPGVQPLADNGIISTHQILDGLGLIETSAGAVQAQQKSKDPPNPQRDHLPILTPAKAGSVSSLDGSPSRTALPALQSSHCANAIPPDSLRADSHDPAAPPSERPAVNIYPKSRSTGSMPQVKKQRGRPPGPKAAGRRATNPMHAPSQTIYPPTSTHPEASASTESVSTRMANTLRAISTLPADTTRAIEDIHPIFQQSILSFYNPHTAFYTTPSLDMDSQNLMSTSPHPNGLDSVSQLRNPQPLVYSITPDLFSSEGDPSGLWDEELFEQMPMR